MKIILLLLFCQSPPPPPPSPFKTLEPAAARSLLLVQAYRNTGFRYATGAVVDPKRGLAIVPWHAVKDGPRIRAVGPAAEGLSNPNTYAAALADAKRTDGVVLYAEPWNDLALVRFDSLPAESASTRFKHGSIKPESKLYLDGHPYERNLVYQRMEGSYRRTEHSRWDWSGQGIDAPMLAIEVAEGPGHGFSGGIVRDEAGDAVGMVCAGQDSKLYAVDGGVVDRFRARADLIQGLVERLSEKRGAPAKGLKP